MRVNADAFLNPNIWRLVAVEDAQFETSCLGRLENVTMGSAFRLAGIIPVRTFPSSLPIRLGTGIDAISLPLFLCGGWVAGRAHIRLALPPFFVRGEGVARGGYHVNYSNWSQETAQMPASRV